MPDQTEPPMLHESDVIHAVCHYLSESAGWTIIRRCNESEKGDDILARGPAGQTASIEAKGETSSKAASARYGRPFSGTQVRHHVAMAFYRAVEVLGKGRLAGVAFSDNRPHRRYVKRIRPGLESLGITVFWVDRNGDVLVEDYGKWLPGSEKNRHLLFLPACLPRDQNR